MELQLTRTERTEESTIGHLHINGVHECFILEDRDRGLKQDMEPSTIKSMKVYGKTAIPSGRYEIAITYSNKFKKYLPLLLNVQGFAGIRIHPGNIAANSEGCLLPGDAKQINKVINSRVAFNRLFTKLKDVAKKEKIFIEII